MKDIFVKLDDNSYKIKIGWGINSQIDNQIIDLIKAFLPNPITANKVVIVTDKNVVGLYANSLANRLEKGGILVKQICLTPGENQKNSFTLEKIYKAFFEHQMDRKCFAIAIGGGVVGDLTGFAASTFMRGIPYIQIPTTLLAQVDSSVGGKTAINHPKGKNMIGSFYQPKGVFIDTSTLITLPKEELLAGLVEVIKYGMIRCESLFHYIGKYQSDILHLNERALEYIIYSSCKVKAEIVEEDEKEGGVRAILNFGHTIGHAIEALTDYCKYRHGEAVGIGMVYAAKIASKMGIADSSVAVSLENLLKSLNLDTEVKDVDPKQIIEKLYQDKKTIGGRLRFVLPIQIGEVMVTDKVSEDIIFNVLT